MCVPPKIGVPHRNLTKNKVGGITRTGNMNKRSIEIDVKIIKNKDDEGHRRHKKVDSIFFHNEENKNFYKIMKTTYGVCESNIVEPPPRPIGADQNKYKNRKFKHFHRNLFDVVIK